MSPIKLSVLCAIDVHKFRKPIIISMWIRGKKNITHTIHLYSYYNQILWLNRIIIETNRILNIIFTKHTRNTNIYINLFYVSGCIMHLLIEYFFLSVINLKSINKLIFDLITDATQKKNYLFVNYMKSPILLIHRRH